jgi:hypothetical protein
MDGSMVFLPLMLIWLRDPMYFNTPSRWAMVGLAVSIGLIAPHNSPQINGSIPSVNAADFTSVDPARVPAEQAQLRDTVPTLRIREGTRLAGRIGSFTQLDDGWYFQPEREPKSSAAGSGPVSANHTGGSAVQAAVEASGVESRSTLPHRLRVIENLALQRVAQTIQQDPADQRWSISGIITEFFDENRLMILSATRAPLQSDSQR